MTTAAPRRDEWTVKIHSPPQHLSASVDFTSLAPVSFVVVVSLHRMSAEEAAAAEVSNKEEETGGGGATKNGERSNNRPRREREEQPPVEELYDLTQPIPRVRSYCLGRENMIAAVEIQPTKAKS